jgi:hypothetical protein
MFLNCMARAQLGGALRLRRPEPDAVKTAAL